MKTLIIILIVLTIGGGIGGLITLLLLRRWTKAVLSGGGSPVKPITSEKAADFFDRKASSFVVTTERDFAHSPDLVFAALDNDGLFSWIPFVDGIRYNNGSRGVGTTRTFDSKLFATAERVVSYEAGHKITLTGDRVSIPIVVKSFAQEYKVTPNGNGGTALKWTIAAHPRLGGLIPLRVCAPIVRPFAKAGIRGLDSRI